MPNGVGPQRMRQRSAIGPRLCGATLDAESRELKLERVALPGHRLNARIPRLRGESSTSLLKRNYVPRPLLLGGGFRDDPQWPRQVKVARWSSMSAWKSNSNASRTSANRGPFSEIGSCTSCPATSRAACQCARSRPLLRPDPGRPLQHQPPRISPIPSSAPPREPIHLRATLHREPYRTSVSARRPRGRKAPSAMGPATAPGSLARLTLSGNGTADQDRGVLQHPAHPMAISVVAAVSAKERGFGIGQEALLRIGG